MRRGRIAIAVAVAAAGCGADGPAPNPLGVTDLSVAIERDTLDDTGPPAYFIEVGYRYKPVNPIDDERGGGLSVRAACQVGAIRYLDESTQTARRGRPTGSGRSSASPFIINNLPDKPTLCELELGERFQYDSPPAPLVTVCAERGMDKPRPGRCPPNPVDGPGRAGFSVPSLDVVIEDADPPDAVMRLPRRLVLYYVVQAHRDAAPDTWVEMAIACPTGSDDVSHSDAAKLRAGEAFKAGQIKLAGRVPDDGARCTIGFAAHVGVNGPREPIETFCYSPGQPVTRGACP